MATWNGNDTVKGLVKRTAWQELWKPFNIKIHMVYLLFKHRHRSTDVALSSGALMYMESYGMQGKTGNVWRKGAE